MSENLGFITVIDQPKAGLMGGYLVLNQAGRPLEFHCTVPVLPDRIQEILYGEALQPFLYGERIAHTLFKRSKIPVSYIFTNHSAVLPLQNITEIPVIYVFDKRLKKQHSEDMKESLKLFGITDKEPAAEQSEMPETVQLPAVRGFDTEAWKEQRIGNRWIAVPNQSEKMIKDLTGIARTVDFAEPFSRIYLAVEESRRAA